MTSAGTMSGGGNRQIKGRMGVGQQAKLSRNSIEGVSPQQLEEMTRDIQV